MKLSSSACIILAQSFFTIWSCAICYVAINLVNIVKLFILSTDFVSYIPVSFMQTIFAIYCINLKKREMADIMHDAAK